MCRAPNDFAGDPELLINPISASIFVTQGLASLKYTTTQVLPLGTTFTVYFNHVIIDRNGHSNKVYQYEDIMNLINFAVVPVAPGVDQTDYDPLVQILIYHNRFQQ